MILRSLHFKKRPFGDPGRWSCVQWLCAFQTCLTSMQSWCVFFWPKNDPLANEDMGWNGWKNGPKKSEQFFLFAQASSTLHTISPYFTIIWVSWSKRSSSPTRGQPVLPWRWSLFAASNSEAFPGRSRLSRGKWNMFLPLSQQSFHHHLSDIAPSMFLSFRAE